MTVADTLLQTLRASHRVPARELLERLQVSRATLMRAVHALGPQVVSRGRARRSAYAPRRTVRGTLESLPLFRVDEQGRAHEVATLIPTYPNGCALDCREPFAWPLDEDMADGWFDGLPYPLEDMRPQGFLGRHFARHNASLLQVNEDPRHWSEDDTLYALALLGSDQPGCYILGETALRHWLIQAQQDPTALAEANFQDAYLALAANSMALGVAGSSAGGEFPKFTAVRRRDGGLVHVIVKFSGSDNSPGTQRWSDLLVCEHLALEALAKHLRLPAARSHIHQAGGRTFLEVERFDRHQAHGRSPVCSWASLNGAFFGLGGKPWTSAAQALRDKGFIDEPVQESIELLWHFGQLIANSDMHEGNLSFLPGLRMAPAYDMLPMLYAPVRGVELPQCAFEPGLPLPAQRTRWQAAAGAAQQFWNEASQDSRISAEFRDTCARNARHVGDLLERL
ncbi:type II toxin-antitoxin system HipA family toxin YjjJ [Polaromonas sp. C04]|uniref:type II toxin-antitoxin system HipA family toxin YjjJ n=1 Tax=Polaromonas sp. C04 TaxID=1945857 RepID=UPI000987621B|nr:type II toxin-antitoxin system HipA family toxin YjjJ [Polaromonas sp. C04]OOG58847.1 DNA-binding protein [Polaromonas sp. C04]